MSTNTTFIATNAAGAVMTRSSKTRTYTHAVVVAGVDGGYYTWNGRPDLAHKEAMRLAPLAAREGDTIEIVEVTAHPYSSPEAKAARAAEKKRIDDANDRGRMEYTDAAIGHNAR